MIKGEAWADTTEAKQMMRKAGRLGRARSQGWLIRQREEGLLQVDLNNHPRNTAVASREEAVEVEALASTNKQPSKQLKEDSQPMSHLSFSLRMTEQERPARAVAGSSTRRP